MRIAIPVAENQIIYRFGMAEHFKFYDFDCDDMKGAEELWAKGSYDTRIVETNGVRRHDLAVFLKERDVDVAVSDFIGDGMLQALKDNDIVCYADRSGDADEIIGGLFNGAGPV